MELKRRDHGKTARIVINIKVRDAAELERFMGTIESACEEATRLSSGRPRKGPNYAIDVEETS